MRSRADAADALRDETYSDGPRARREGASPAVHRLQAAIGRSWASWYPDLGLLCDDSLTPDGLAYGDQSGGTRRNIIKGAGG